MKKDKQPSRPKNKGQSLMVSVFLTPGGPLQVPDTISDAEILRNPMWPKRNGCPVRDAFEYLEYGKGNYWTGE